MRQYLIIAIIGLAALITAIVSNKLVEPASTAVMAEYQSKYQALKAKSEITAEEKAQLEVLFRKVNSEGNIKAELWDVIFKYSLALFVLVPLSALAARWCRLEQNGVFFAAALIFLIFILNGSIIYGALMASAFVISGLAFKKRIIGRQE